MGSEAEVKDEQTPEMKALLDSAEKSEGNTEEGQKEKTAEELAAENKTAEENSLQEKLDELQEQNRDQAKTISNMEKTLAKYNEILVKAKLIEVEDPEAEAQTAAIEKARNASLETMLELMALNPAYQDVRTVVTRKRFDDIVEQLARVKVTKDGGRLVDAVTAIEDEIWAMTNPYRYMYGKIKEFHPDYRKKGDEENPPTDIHDIPGGQSPKGAGVWTAAKIDALDEDELDQVPADIYQKYLRNELS